MYFKIPLSFFEQMYEIRDSQNRIVFRCDMNLIPVDYTRKEDLKKFMQDIVSQMNNYYAISVSEDKVNEKNCKVNEKIETLNPQPILKKRGRPKKQQ